MESTFSTADKIRSNTYIGTISIEVGGKPVTVSVDSRTVPADARIIIGLRLKKTIKNILSAFIKTYHRGQSLKIAP